MESTALKKHTWGGARIGAGAPIASRTLQTQQMREMLVNRLKMEWIPIVNKAISQALKGDRSAREWLSGYALGKSKEQIEHTDGVSLYHLLKQLEANHGDLKDKD